MMTQNENQARQGIQQAMSAIQWLAAQCDGARADDGAGFSMGDVALGHALAWKTPWSAREALAACRLIVKYKKQLEKGAVNVSAIGAMALELKKSLGEEDGPGRLKMREIVSGRIWVDESAQRIILRFNYNADVVAACRELIGRSWDPEAQAWSAALCAENALAVEEIASRWGMSLKPHAGWTSLMPMRKVERVGDRLFLHGVHVWGILKSMPSLAGRPNQDALIFDALEVVDANTIAIPLRSWTIREALLWFETLEPDSRIASSLHWARDMAVAQLQAAYTDAAGLERERFSRASALSVPEDQLSALRALLPPAMAARLLPHQWVAVQSVVEQHQLILADQQGLGKTIEILAGLEALHAFPAIVIAPATALLNWRDEAASWLPHRRVAVAGGNVGKRDRGVPLKDADLVILNYESFGKHAELLLPLHPRALVADEAQYLKGHDSVRTQAVKQFCRDAAVGRIIAASGTPVMNRPAELLTLLTALPSVLAALGGFKRMASRYCQATSYTMSFSTFWDYSGSANLGELANRLRETGCFVRREKSAVLPDLSEKARHVLQVEITNREEYDLATQDLNAWLKKKNIAVGKRYPTRQSDAEESALLSAAAWLGWGKEELETLRLDQNNRHEAIRRIGALRQIAGSGKITAAIDWILQKVKDEKLVVFAYHLEVQEALVDAATGAGVSPLSITGDMSIQARQDAIKKFQNDPAARLIICSLKAAQTAITLTAARRALMVELDWTPSALEQAEDRIHRIGQRGEVDITYLHAANTLDDRMAAVIDSKRLKISVIGAANAPHGYRTDGAPRLRAPGPGCPRLSPDERERRRKASKAAWQAQHSEYMRDYMRQARLKKKIKQAKEEIRIFKRIERLGLEGMLVEKFAPEVSKFRRRYTEEHYQKELAEARNKAEAAQNFLDDLAAAAQQPDRSPAPSSRRQA
jgi:hypothetical protein